MPTVLRSGPYRFFFYSADRGEPPHVHVEGRRAAPSSDSFLFGSTRASGSDRPNFGGSSGLSKRTPRHCCEPGMTSLSTELQQPRAQRVAVTDDMLHVDLPDGRTVTVPVSWYPRLAHGTSMERTNCCLVGGGEGLHWPDLDEDINVEDLLAGRRSGESQGSLARWLWRLITIT
jgi:hypothetical protein